jgi:hypothetical protein
MNISTNIGKIFLKLINTEFPPAHPLHKVFNRNNVKLSYSCMANIAQTIKAHNKYTLSRPPADHQARECNCPRGRVCPLAGKCLTKSIVYQATVETSDGNPKQTYVGLTENQFKTRYNNHTATFRNPAKRLSTELSKHIWGLKDSNIDYNLKWEILQKAKPYSSATKRCNLCITEKYYIIYEPHKATLNRRNELVSTCRHSGKHLLANHKT